MRASRLVLALASDERLAEEVRRGNEAAFETLYERHGAAMLSLCRHLLSSQEEAEEALQHAFAAVWSYLQRHRPVPPRLRPWLFAIARNRCLSLLRARRPAALELGEVPCTAGLADEVTRRADVRGLLSDLRDLPEEQRTALLLSELGGLSHTDIAAVLSRKEDSVKGLVFRARSTLIDWREARETPCKQFREQLSVLRGGALRRKILRRHLQGCPGCRAFRHELRRQRGMIAVILPVAPSAGLKGTVLTAGFAGAAASGGATAGLGAATLIPIGGSAAATMAVVGVLAAGALTSTEKAPGKALTSITRASHARTQAPRSDRSRPSPTRRQRTPVRTPPGQADGGAGTSPQATGQPWAAAGQPSSASGQPSADGHPASAADQPSAGEHPSTAAGQQPSSSMTKADKEAAAKIAKADQEEADKIAKADREEADKVAKADREVAKKRTEAAYRDAAEKKAKAQQEAAEKRAKARAEANQERDKARQEAEQKRAKARQEGTREERQGAGRGSEEELRDPEALVVVPNTARRRRVCPVERNCQTTTTEDGAHGAGHSGG